MMTNAVAAALVTALTLGAGASANAVEKLQWKDASGQSVFVKPSTTYAGCMSNSKKLNYTMERSVAYCCRVFATTAPATCPK
jgi:hypothetical protein